MNKLILLLAGTIGIALAALGPIAAEPQPATDATPSPAVAPEALLSRSALRRARLLIQLRMLELREERLTCLRAVLLRRLPPDLVAPQPETATGGRVLPVKHSGAAHATFTRSALSESEDCSWTPGPRSGRKPTG